MLFCVQRCCQCLSNWGRMQADQVWAATYAVRWLCSMGPRSDSSLPESSQERLGILHVPSADLCALMQRCGTPPAHTASFHMCAWPLHGCNQTVLLAFSAVYLESAGDCVHCASQIVSLSFERSVSAPLKDFRRFNLVILSIGFCVDLQWHGRSCSVPRRLAVLPVSPSLPCSHSHPASHLYPSWLPRSRWCGSVG